MGQDIDTIFLPPPKCLKMMLAQLLEVKLP